MKAVAYLRVSTKKQASSLKTQRWLIEDWTQKTNTEIISWHEDFGKSGWLPVSKRPGLMAAFKSMSDTETDTLVVAYKDRSARGFDLFKTCLEPYGQKLVCTQELPGTELCSNGLADLLNRGTRREVRACFDDSNPFGADL